MRKKKRERAHYCSQTNLIIAKNSLRLSEPHARTIPGPGMQSSILIWWFISTQPRSSRAGSLLKPLYSFPHLSYGLLLLFLCLDVESWSNDFLSLAPHPCIPRHRFPAQTDSSLKVAASKYPCLTQWNLPARCKTALASYCPHQSPWHNCSTTAGAGHCPVQYTQLTPVPLKLARLTAHWKRIRKGSQRLLHHQQITADQALWGKRFFWLPCFPSTSPTSKKMLIPWAFSSLLVKHCHQPAQVPFAHSHKIISTVITDNLVE